MLVLELERVIGCAVWAFSMRLRGIGRAEIREVSCLEEFEALQGAFDADMLAQILSVQDSPSLAAVGGITRCSQR